MDQVDPLRREPIFAWASRRAWQIASIGLTLVSAGLFVAVLISNLEKPKVSFLLLIAMTAAFCIFSLLLAKVLLQLRQEQREAAVIVRDIEQEFQQMAGNIQEIFWMIDADRGKALYVNQAYETITGRSCQSLMEDPSSYKDVIDAGDRMRVLEKLENVIQNGQLNERFRIVRPGGEVRWIWVQGFPVRKADGQIYRLVGTAVEITAEMEAEKQVETSLALARSSWAEADALRKATLGLTQDLRMDFVLDALLQSLADLVPYTCARVLIPEGGPHVLSLGEKLCAPISNPGSEFPLTLSTEDSPLLQRTLAGQNSILISDTLEEESWQTFRGHEHLRSWLSVPLVASGRYLGFLSVGHTEPNRFTQDHLRRAELLAIPAAAAIQNSRLYERAGIYGEELEKRIEDLHQAEAALLLLHGERRMSDDKFQKVFRSSPIPFSITTVAEGLFLDVNSAFEERYGYSRTEVIGRTFHELKIWEDPSDRALVVAQLHFGPIRNFITRLRTKSGEVRTTTYFADKIQFDGQTCVLAVSEDLPEHEPLTN